MFSKSKKEPNSFDIAIVGGGLTGLIMAVALSQSKLKVALIAKGGLKRLKKTKSTSFDNRTTAIMYENIAYLDQLGLWQQCQNSAAPLEEMVITREDKSYSYQAQDLGYGCFAYNVPNNLLRDQAITAIQQSDNITHIDDMMQNLNSDEQTIRIQCSDDRWITSRLLIGADGANSTTRILSGIRVNEHKPEQSQSALVCNLKLSKPHNNGSYEVHRSGGPITLVPMKDPHTVALVWCDRQTILEDAISMTPSQRHQTIEYVTRQILGEVKESSEPKIWPIRPFIAERFYSKRVALIGEAAHALPPLGAQGFNCSIRDIKALAENIYRTIDLGGDIGEQSTLLRYDRKRALDVNVRLKGVVAVNQAMMKQNLFNQLISKVVSFTHANDRLRKPLMMIGMTDISNTKAKRTTRAI